LDADHAILTMFRRGIVNIQRVADVVDAWEQPPFDWGSRTAWRLFNAATYALTGRVVENNDTTPRLHAIVDDELRASEFRYAPKNTASSLAGFSIK
jgi:hypothetical protein